MEDRKKDHIQLAIQSQTLLHTRDQRFQYEPLLSGHRESSIPQASIGGKIMRVPIWVSSMTGGTKLAGKINRNLAQVCREFGMGMGLGSCRILMDDDKYFPDFDMREIIGEDQPLYANIGIAQLEDLLEKDELERVDELVDKLQADGLIVHVNPMQEWLQPEGDRLNHPPLIVIREALMQLNSSMIVKEEGQGMGYESLRELLQLPLDAVEFAAFGGTNFAKVELLRSTAERQALYEPLAAIGHSATEMMDMVNQLISEGLNVQTKALIASGGIHTFLDGYYLIGKSELPAVYGQASAFLKYAQQSYEELHEFTRLQIEGLTLAYNYLKVNK